MPQLALPRIRSAGSTAAPDAAVPDADAPAGHAPRRPRIVIVSARVGAGHDGAAAELARRLECDGFHVDRHDFLDLLPARLGAMVAGSYHGLLTRAPGGYQRIYAATERDQRPAPAVRALLRSAESRMLRAIPADTAAVVSTYPGASQVLGALRRRGVLTVPAVTYLTDFSVHALWVASGVDVHVAAHAVPAQQALARDAAGVRVCGPVVDPRFVPATAADRDAARLRFGLPPGAPLGLLVAGSWGVGAVEQAAAELRGSGTVEPVVVCGRNEALAARLRAQGFAHVHGWVADMPGLMHACDILVQNAGGLTSLEAFASGLPVASYRCIPGHGQTNAAALQEAGLAVWIREPDALAAALGDLLHGAGGERQRALGLALFTPGEGAAHAVASTARGAARRPDAPHVPGPPPPPRLPVPAQAGPAPALAADAARLRTAHVPPVPASPAAPWAAVPAARPPAPAQVRAPARRRALRGARLVAVAALCTVLFGIGAPVAEAYADSPGEFAALTHFLEGGPR